MSGSPSSNPSAARLRVGGLTRFSTCDWPGELTATVFCQGCAWDCAYCHNPNLRPIQTPPQISWTTVLEFLESRRGLLDGVVFSGGEPTLQPALLDAVKAVRNLGYKVGLHTAGMASERFANLLPWLDWVGFDVKAPSDAYSRITCVERSGDQALASLRLLVASGIPYEVRTTLHSALLSLADMMELRNELLLLGVTDYVVQHFRSEGTRSERLPLSAKSFLLPADFGDCFRHFQIR